jgi:hypothetical protein
VVVECGVEQSGFYAVVVRLERKVAPNEVNGYVSCGIKKIPVVVSCH